MNEKDKKELEQLRAERDKKELEQLRAERDKKENSFTAKLKKEIKEPIKKENKKKVRIGCITLIVIVISLVVIGAISEANLSEEDKAKRDAKIQKERDTKIQKENERKKKENERKKTGAHCVGGLFGNLGVNELERIIINRLNDRDSFENRGTKITPKNAKNQHTIFMEYSAKNAFGGVVVKTAVAIINSSDCKLVSVLAYE